MPSRLMLRTAFLHCAVLMNGAAFAQCSSTILEHRNSSPSIDAAVSNWTAGLRCNELDAIRATILNSELIREGTWRDYASVDAVDLYARTLRERLGAQLRFLKDNRNEPLAFHPHAKALMSDLLWVRGLVAAMQSTSMASIDALTSDSDLKSTLRLYLRVVQERDLTTDAVYDAIALDADRVRGVLESIRRTQIDGLRLALSRLGKSADDMCTIVDTACSAVDAAATLGRTIESSRRRIEDTTRDDLLAARREIASSARKTLSMGDRVRTLSSAEADAIEGAVAGWAQVGTVSERRLDAMEGIVRASLGSRDDLLDKLARSYLRTVTVQALPDKSLESRMSLLEKPEIVGQTVEIAEQNLRQLLRTQEWRVDANPLGDIENEVGQRIERLVQDPVLLRAVIGGVARGEEALRQTRDELDANRKALIGTGRLIETTIQDGINRAEKFGSRIDDIQQGIQGAPDAFASALSGHASELLGKQRDLASTALADALSSSGLLSDISDIANLPDTLKTQAKDLLGGFDTESLKNSFGEMMTNSPMMITGGLVVASAAFSEMQARKRHKKVMRMLAQISAKLDKMDKKLDQLLDGQKLMQESLQRIETQLASIERKQTVGFRMIMAELLIIRTMTADLSSRGYCSCRALLFPNPEFGPYDTISRRNELRFFVNRAAGLSLPETCLNVMRKTEVPASYALCRDQLLNGFTAPGRVSPVLTVDAWARSPDLGSEESDASESRRLVHSQRTSLGTVLDLARACSKLRGKGVGNPVGGPANALHEVLKQSYEAVGAEGDEIANALLACAKDPEWSTASIEQPYFAAENDLWAPLVLWHAFAAGNVQMYERARANSEGGGLVNARKMVADALRLVDRLGRPLSLEAGGPVLPLAVNAADVVTELEAKGCRLPESATPEALRGQCEGYAQLKSFLDTALAPADEGVATLQPLLLGNLGTVLVGMKFSGSEPSYAIASRAARSGCRACLTSQLGPAWMVTHESESPVCSRVLESQRQTYRTRDGKPTNRLEAEARESGWCAYRSIERTRAVRSILGDEHSEERIVRAMVPLPMPELVREGRLYRSIQSEPVAEIARWLYAELVEIEALKATANPIGDLLYLGVKEKSGISTQSSVTSCTTPLLASSTTHIDAYVTLEAIKLFGAMCSE